MIENFMRRPVGKGALAADIIRVVGALSVVVAAVFFSPTDAGILAFALPGLLLPRFVGVRPWFDILFGVTLLVAAWSNVFDVYTKIVWWDVVVHFICTAVLAATLFLFLSRLSVITGPGADSFVPASAIVLTTSFGLALSAVWEMVEWIGHEFISDEIFVAYADTIGDMAIGGLGALVAGFVVARAPVLIDPMKAPEQGRGSPRQRYRT